MNSEIILCKDIKLDRNYNNVLDYSETQMVELCRQNQIASSIKYSFIQPDKNSVDVGFSYAQCVQANYIAFKNPSFSNKWFFAFIDNVEFLSKENTRIHYTVDVWSTWFSYWKKKKCYIVRQHVLDDTVGSNTQPETVDLGKAMVVEGETDKLYTTSGVTIIVAPKADSSSPVDGRYVNGIYCGLGGYYGLSDTSVINGTIQDYWQDYSRVVRIFQHPSVLNNPNTLYTDNITITRKATIDSYTPVNKKLLTFPYKQLRVVSSSGENTVFQYELFGNTIKFDIEGALLPNCYIMLYPENYRGMTKDFTKKIVLNADMECAWSSGTYTNGIVSQKTADALNLVSNALVTGIGIAAAPETGGASIAVVGAIAGATKIGNNLNDYVKGRNESGAVKGGTSNNVIDYVAGNLGFRVLEESIKAEYAREIDNYFTKYGYAINNIEMPNINGRLNWNYIEIGAQDSIGYGSVPSNFMETINSACRKGVTIWHDHSKLGDYNLPNNILI